MNINLITHSYQALGFLKENILYSFTSSQKKTILIASLAFACLATIYGLNRYFKVKKFDEAEKEQAKMKKVLEKIPQFRGPTGGLGLRDRNLAENIFLSLLNENFFSPVEFLRIQNSLVEFVKLNKDPFSDSYVSVMIYEGGAIYSQQEVINCHKKGCHFFTFRPPVPFAKPEKQLGLTPDFLNEFKQADNEKKKELLLKVVEEMDRATKSAEKKA